MMIIVCHLCKYVLLFVLHSIMFAFCYFAVPYVFHCTGRRDFIHTPFKGIAFLARIRNSPYEKFGVAEYRNHLSVATHQVDRKSVLLSVRTHTAVNPTSGQISMTLM